MNAAVGRASGKLSSSRNRRRRRRESRRRSLPRPEREGADVGVARAPRVRFAAGADGAVAGDGSRGPPTASAPVAIPRRDGEGRQHAAGCGEDGGRSAGVASSDAIAKEARRASKPSKLSRRRKSAPWALPWS